MTANRPETLSKLTSRKKIIGIIFVVVILIILWEGIGMFTGRKSSFTQPVAVRPTTAMNAGIPLGGRQAQPMTPRPAPLPKPQTAATSPQEIALQQIQQETEKNYVTAINQLQMLRIQKDIAETNKAIMAAKLDTVTSEKKVVDLLAPPAPPPTSYAQGLLNPQAGGPPVIGPPPQAEANYAVISVSQLQHKWGAVLGYQGNLYSVSVGDVLPADRSIVLHIDKSGVILEKNGVKKKFSLVPII